MKLPSIPSLCEDMLRVGMTTVQVGEAAHLLITYQDAVEARALRRKQDSRNHRLHCAVERLTAAYKNVQVWHEVKGVRDTAPKKIDPSLL